MHGESDTDINLAIERNLHDLYRETAYRAALPLTEDRSLSYVLSRPSKWPESLFRACFEPHEAADKVAEVAARARSGELPRTWKVGPSSSPAGLGELLLSSGYVLAFDNVNMAAELAKIAKRPARRSGVETRRVEQESELADWIGVVARGLWEWEPTEVPLLLPVIRPLVAAGRFIAHLTLLNGVAAAAAATFRTDGTVGLYDVATLPEFRSRGLGREVVCAALHHARDAGGELGILHASEMGEPLYRKLGFLPFGRLSTYRLADS